MRSISFLFAALLLVAVPNVEAEVVATMPTELPLGLFSASAAAAGHHIYIFGGNLGSDFGNDHFYDQILRFDPITGQLETMAATLPLPGRNAAAAVTVGEAIYLFGGASSVTLDDVLRFDPATGALETVGAMPGPRQGHSAFTHAGFVYVAGGHDGGRWVDSILKYDPYANTWSTATAHLPTGRHDMALAWTGEIAYFFGGYPGGNTDEILRYDPTIDVISVAAARLPTPRAGARGFWDGHTAFIIGGEGGDARPQDSEPLDEILRYDPATDTIASIAAHLPSARFFAESVWHGGRGFIVGGQPDMAGREALGEILQFISIESATDPVTSTVSSLLRTAAASAEPSGAIWNALTSHPELLDHAQRFGEAAAGYEAKLLKASSTIERVLDIRSFLQSQRAFGQNAWELVVSLEPGIDSAFSALDEARAQAVRGQAMLEPLEEVTSRLKTVIPEYLRDPTPERADAVAAAFGDAIPHYRGAADELETIASQIEGAAALAINIRAMLEPHRGARVVGGLIGRTADSIGLLEGAVSSAANGIREEAALLTADAAIMSEALPSEDNGVPMVSWLLTALAATGTAGVRRRLSRSW